MSCRTKEISGREYPEMVGRCAQLAPNYRTEHAKKSTQSFGDWVTNLSHSENEKGDLLPLCCAQHCRTMPNSVLQDCNDILDESGLSPDALMRMDASRRFTPAKHKTFQDCSNA